MEHALIGTVVAPATFEQRAAKTFVRKLDRDTLPNVR